MTDEDMIRRVIDRVRTPGPPVYGPCPRCGQLAEYLDKVGVIVACPICVPLALEAIHQQTKEGD